MGIDYFDEPNHKRIYKGDDDFITRITVQELI